VNKRAKRFMKPANHAPFIQHLHRDPLLVFSIFSWIILAGTIVALQFINPLGLLTCPVKATIGFPCLTCGITRMFHHISTGSFYRALTTQPLGFMTLFGLLFYGPIVYFFDGAGRVFKQIKTHAGLLGVGYGGLLILNWFYLVSMGI